MIRSSDKEFSIAVKQRHFIKDVRLPYLPRLRLYDPACKPEGVQRLKRKLGQAADTIVHGWIKLPARGEFDVRVPDGTWCKLEFDAHQSAYLAFASRELSGGYEPVETMFLNAILPRCRVFYDIGANWGYYSLLAATHPEFSGETFAFEISDAMNSALKRMTKKLALNRLEIVGYGLSDHSGSVAATPGHAAHLTKVAPVTDERLTGTQQVQVKRMDDLSLPAPDLIKMDVEDHEVDVLRGGLRTLDQHKPLILFESRSGKGGMETGDLLRMHDYAIYGIQQRTGEEGFVHVSTADASDPRHESVNFLAIPNGQEHRWFE